ncbi:FMN-binding split barrel [Pleurotus pulmonarius]
MRLLATAATRGFARNGRCQPCTRPFSSVSVRWKESKPNGEGANYLHDSRDERYKSWDFAAEIPPKNGYKVLTSAIIPRPIAFVSSVSAEGAPNLAPFSYFSMVSHNPPLLSISFSLSPRRPKDTRENILSTKKFTVNIISDDFIEAANSTSVEAPADVDEWLISGLTMAYGESGWPARVRESAISLECELYFSKDIPKSEADATIGTTLILGLIKKVHIRESVLSDDGESVDPRKLRVVARLGGLEYATIGHRFELPRPSWKELKDSFRVK